MYEPLCVGYDDGTVEQTSKLHLAADRAPARVRHAGCFAAPREEEDDPSRLREPRDACHAIRARPERLRCARAVAVATRRAE